MGEIATQDNSALIIKDNALINATYMLDLIEQRLLLLAIARVNETRTSLTPDTEITITAKDYADQFGLGRHAAYKALKDAEKRLYERTFTFNRITDLGNIERVKRRWITGYSYVENEAVVRIKFESDVIPLITALEKRFTSYRINQVSKLSSIYAIRLYEILISWKRLGTTPEISIEDFRSQVGVLETEYKRMHHFKERVLHAAIDQINEHTDLYDVEYQQYHSGRSIKGLSFSFKVRKPTALLESIDEAKAGQTEHDIPDGEVAGLEMSGKQRSYFGGLLAADQAFGSKYAPAGMTASLFNAWVCDQLKDPEQISKWKKYLLKHGFKFPQAK